MKYLSLFSGIEAATVAWNPLNWGPVGFSEVEKFPNAVLEHHYPNVKNFGDIQKITEDQIKQLGSIDLIVGGFPCQDLSVAGKRKGLKNDDGSATRSGLFFDAMRIVRWARKHCGTRWVVIENVPGLYSSNNGRDFASVVGEVVGSEFGVPRNGWKSAGVAAGPDGLCEWVCLDAQFCGVAQRRRRVFIVGDFGNWRGRPPLFSQCHRLQGNPAPRREKREEVAPNVAKSIRGNSGGRDREDMHTLIPYGGNNTSGSIEVATAVKGNNSNYDFESETFIAFSCKDNGRDCNENVSPTLRAMGCERANGGGQLASEVAYPLTAEAGKTGKGDSAQCIAIRTANTSSNGHGIADEVAYTLDPANGQAVATPNAGALSAQPGAKQQSYIRNDMAVRRLLPEECESLQGLPRGYTRIPWCGKAPKDCPDGPRYRALGNSFAVPVVRWIGSRIQLTEDILNGQGL